MTKHTGRLVNFGFGKEATRGTSVAPSFWYPKTGTNFQDKFETVMSEASFGSIIDSNGFDIVKRWSDGEVTGNLGVNGMSLLLLSIFGSVNSVVDTGTAYKHTFTLNSSSISPSLTLAIADPVQSRRYANCVVSSVTIKVELKKYVEITVNFMGKEGVNSTETVVYTDDNLLLAHNTSILFADTLVDLDTATSSGCIKSFELTLERTLIEDECVGSIAPIDYLGTVFAISGSMELTYDSTEYHDRAMSGGVKAMRVMIQDGSTIIGGATSSPELTFDFGKVGLTEFSRTVSNTEIVTQSLGFKAFSAGTDSQSLSAILVNTTTSI